MIINGDKIKSSIGKTIGINDRTTLGVDGEGLSFSSNGVGLSGRPGTIIESLWSLCDGSIHTILSGTYTVQNVTSQQGLNNTFTDINGSVINYVPPVGTNKVIYRFTYANYWVASSTHGISHHSFFIDGIEVSQSRHCRSVGAYSESRYTFEWVIEIGGGFNDPITGKQSSWTTLKNLKMQARDYSDGNNEQNLHGTYYWDQSSGVFNMPMINIIALR